MQADQLDRFYLARGEIQDLPAAPFTLAAVDQGHVMLAIGRNLHRVTERAAVTIPQQNADLPKPIRSIESDRPLAGQAICLVSVPKTLANTYIAINDRISALCSLNLRAVLRQGHVARHDEPANIRQR